MEKYDVMIVAAGNGTRMGENSLPKILININGVVNLHNTFDKLSQVEEIGNVYLVVNKRNYPSISLSVAEYKQNNPSKNINVELIEIESGRGDGHAVLEAHKKIPTDSRGCTVLSEWFFVMWGDAYLTSHEIINDCIREKKYNKFGTQIPMFIPVINEKNPYVTFIVDSEMSCISADFSKRGEHHPTGFHDQCIFFCNRSIICSSLNTLEKAYFKNGRYVTDSGELTFLYLVHFLYNSLEVGAKAIITDAPVLSYNTAGEVKEIEQILNNT